MEATDFSETSLSIYQTAWCIIEDDHNLLCFRLLGQSLISVASLTSALCVWISQACYWHHVDGCHSCSRKWHQIEAHGLDNQGCYRDQTLSQQHEKIVSCQANHGSLLINTFKEGKNVLLMDIAYKSTSLLFLQCP